MQRHGYKGAFELAATVDYLFGFDATAGVVHDWMYERARQGVRPRRDQPGVPAESNPWALRGIVERLHEAAERGLWAEPDPDADGRDAAGLPRRRGRPGGPVSRCRPRPRRRHRHGGRRHADRRGAPRRCASLRLRDRRRQGATDDPLLARAARDLRAHGGRAGRRPRSARATATAPRRTTTRAVARLARGAGGGVRGGAARSRAGDRGLPGVGRPGVLRLDDPDRRRAAERMRWSTTCCRASARSRCWRPGTGSCCTRSAGRCTSPRAGGCATRSTPGRQPRGDAQRARSTSPGSEDWYDLVGRQPRHARTRSWSPAGVGDVLDDDRRARGRARDAAGWVMDIYLLRRAVFAEPVEEARGAPVSRHPSAGEQVSRCRTSALGSSPNERPDP